MTTTKATTTPTPSTRVPVGVRMRERQRRERPRPAWWTTVAELLAIGVTVTEAAKRVGKSRKVVSAVVNGAAFASLLADTERRALAAAQRALALHRRAAVDALGAALTDTDVPAVERLSAAKALLVASQPPSERQRDEARRELLGALPPALRRAVAEALAGSDTAALAALSDEELARLAGGP